MSSVTVLLSAMGLRDTGILDKLGIEGDSIIINQCDTEAREYFPDRKCLFISTAERGLSKSRNMAIREAALSGKELCIFCDNDVLYTDNYEGIIEDAFNRNPQSDILVFFVERPERHEPVLKMEARLDHVHAMKVFSPEIAFRLSSVIKAGLKLDELFGAGAKYGMGEENIFLFDAMKLRLKITYVPIRIAGTIENKSTWFKGYTEEFFRNRGAGYYRMSKAAYPLLCLQFAVRKRRLYRDNIGFLSAIKAMCEGKREYLSEKRVFLVGDYATGTGPANATKGLLRAMPANTLCLKGRGKIIRALEICFKLPKCDAVVFSGHSGQNILGMKLARKRGVYSVYIMHGAVEHENRINRIDNKKQASEEREMLKLTDCILAVSETFEAWLKENYPEYAFKTGHLTNGIAWEEYYVNQDSVDCDADGGEATPSYVNHNGIGINILSVGGGMPRKNIKSICEAVRLLRERDKMDITLHVAGAEGADTAFIDAYDFVKDHGILGKMALQELYKSCRLFIQNSIFETFGLAPAEALLAGCDIMVSRACGITEVITALNDSDLINNPDDPLEIADKIKAVLKDGNNKRLLASLDTRDTSWEKRAEELCRILEKQGK